MARERGDIDEWANVKHHAANRKTTVAAKTCISSNGGRKWSA